MDNLRQQIKCGRRKIFLGIKSYPYEAHSVVMGTWKESRETAFNKSPKMTLFEAGGCVLVAGSLGGFVNGMLVGSRKFWPGYDEENTWRPGWVGLLLLGAVAALVTWGLYGPSTSVNLGDEQARSTPLTLGQLMICLLTGIGGSSVLTLEARNLILRRERDFAEDAKKKVAKAAILLNKQKKKEDANG